MKNGKGERIVGELEGSRLQSKMRQGKVLSFFLIKRNESCARKRGGGEKEGRGRGGEGGEC